MASHAPILSAPGALGADHFEVSTRAVRAWWASYLLLTPFYVFTSGVPQPADLYLIATFPFVFLIWINRVPQYTMLWIAAAFFAVYLACVNLYWYMIYYSKDFVLHASYYTFNMLKVVITLIVFYCNRAALARTTRRAFFALLIIQAAWVAIFGNNMWGRAIGTFNDPNQLGYWTLLTAVCIFALRPDRTLRFIDLGSLVLAFYIILMTVSRSSMLAFACLLVIVIAFSQVRFRTIVVILLAVLTVTAVLHYYAGLEQYYQDAISFLEKRAKSRTNQFDSLTKRSIERIWLFPQYLFLGSGEGEYMLRFRIRNEAHSSLIAILFCYGIVGFTAFWSLVFVFLRQADWFRMMLFVPPMVYGLANQGVRFSLFWIFLAFVFAMSQPTEAEIDGRSRAAS